MAEIQFQVRSPDLAGGHVPADCTCDGANRIPRLSWTEGPAGTKSYAIVVFDPDAPRPDFVHWLAWNIGPEERRIDDTNAHRFAQGRNGFGDTGWRGPCPPRGDPSHRYVFRVHALDTELELPAGADRAALERAMKDHVLARAEIVATYERPTGPRAGTRA